MKWINYKINCPINTGTEEEPVWMDNFQRKSMSYSERNLAVVLGEAPNGEYTIEDDGQPEQEAPPTDAERIAELEEALALLLSGVTE